MILGLLSVAQAVFLPGYLTLNLAGKRAKSLVETSILVVALSLVVNYASVLLLVKLGVYNRSMVLLLIGCEVAGLVMILALRKHRGRGDAISFDAITFSRANWLAMLAATVAAVLLLLASASLVSEVAKSAALDSWDVLFSWNRWALSWGEGVIPAQTGMYPQLVPAVWSLMYLVMGTRELPVFLLSIWPIFPIATLAMFLDLGVRRRRIEYFLALVACVYITWSVRLVLTAPAENVFRGYVDLPLTFLSMAALYLIELKTDRRLSNWDELWPPLAVASCAALTKANGLYFVGIVLALGLFGHWSSRSKLNRRDWVLSALCTVFLVVVLLGSWYGAKAISFEGGGDTSAASSYASIAAEGATGTGVGARIADASAVVPLSRQMQLFFVGLAALGILSRRSRWVFLTILLPYTVLWIFFLSYDLRNLIVMFPVAAYCAAFGIGAVLSALARVDMGFDGTQGTLGSSDGAALGVMVVVGALVVVASVGLPTTTLHARSLADAKQIGRPSLNAWLYRSIDITAPPTGRMLTDYAFLRFLPGFRDDPEESERSYRTDVTYAYHKDISTSLLNERWSLLLISNQVSSDVAKLVQHRIDDGTYTVIAEYSSDPFMAYAEPVKLRLLRVAQ